MRGRGNEKKTKQLNHDNGKSTWKINDQKMSAAFYKYISKDSVNPYELYTLTLFSTSVSAKTPTPILYLDLILTALKSSDLVIYKFWQPIFSAL